MSARKPPPRGWFFGWSSLGAKSRRGGFRLSAVIGIYRAAMKCIDRPDAECFDRVL